MDEITRSYIVAGEEGRKLLDEIINTRVCGILGLDIAENDHRAIRSCSLELARPRESDRVVKGETNGVLSVHPALVVEKVVLQVIAQRKEWTALWDSDSLVSAFTERQRIGYIQPHYWRSCRQGTERF